LGCWRLGGLKFAASVLRLFRAENGKHQHPWRSW